MRLDIRWRLTLWNTLALAFVLVCFAALVYAMFQQALLGQVDRYLQAGLGQLRNDPRISTATDVRIHHWIEEYQDHLGLNCVVYNSDGTLYGQTPALADKSIPPPDRQDWPYSDRLVGLGRQRILGERMQLGFREFTVVLFASLEPVDEELARLRAVLLAALAVSLLLGTSLAYGLARKSLAPIDRLRRTTETVTADRLDRRLPLPNPHDELGRLASTINGMIARLEKSFTEVRRFTADASHELRTPLTALRAEVEVALGRELSAEEYRQVLGNVLEELGRMSRLTDQLLTLSRADAGVEHLVAVPLDLHRLCQDVVEAMLPLAENMGVVLQMLGRDPVPVAGDESRLRQVIINLLDNAIKHTPRDGHVTVRVDRDETAVMTVQDTGSGIPSEHLPHVFQRFYRVEKARSRADGGTGLGLSIVESIVKAHGGSIELSSTPGVGTTCTVRLPAENRPSLER